MPNKNHRPPTVPEFPARRVERHTTENPEQLSGLLVERARLRPQSLSRKEVLQLQRTIGNQAVQRLLESVPKSEPNEFEASPNQTGLPDGLKAGIESLSGLDISDVRVHGNSDKPEQLDAYAYVQGSDIHLGPGQEKHLPHEAWHVVQQKQGRVTASLQFRGTAVNDDSALEKEADVMGKRARDIGSGRPHGRIRRVVGRNLLASVPVTQLVQKTKTLSSTEAKNAWLQYQKPTYEVKAKYNADHVLSSVTASTAREASKARFEKDGKPAVAPAQWNAMTWTESSEDKIKNKAGAPNAERATNVYQGKQQMTTKLKNIKSRTVVPQSLTTTEARQMKASDYSQYEKDNGSKVYVQFDVGSEVNQEVNGVGTWIPEEGKAEIYHYGGWPANDAMLADYLKWVYDDDTQVGPEKVMKTGL